MVKKILKILLNLLCSMWLINFGIFQVFVFYGEHMCCGKEADGLIYGWIMAGCLIAYIILGIIYEVMLEEE